MEKIECFLTPPKGHRLYVCLQNLHLHNNGRYLLQLYLFLHVKGNTNTCLFGGFMQKYQLQPPEGNTFGQNTSGGCVTLFSSTCRACLYCPATYGNYGRLIFSVCFLIYLPGEERCFGITLIMKDWTLLIILIFEPILTTYNIRWLLLLWDTLLDFFLH